MDGRNSKRLRFGLASSALLVVLFGNALRCTPGVPRRPRSAPADVSPLKTQGAPAGSKGDVSPVLFCDDLKGHDQGSDGFPVWIADSGSWTVTEEGFLGRDSEGSFIALGARSGRKEWRDYRLLLELRVISRASDWRDGAWLGFRNRDGANAYTLGFYDRGSALHKASKGKVTDDARPLGSSATTIRDDAWHSVSIAAVGRRITASLDGKVVIEATDEGWNDSPPVTSGGIVLGARKYEKAEGSTRVVFRNIRVEPVGSVPKGMRFTMADAREAARRNSKRVSLLEFLKSRRRRRYVRVPRKVLAFYYTWYGAPERHGSWVHWDGVDPERGEIATSTNYPMKGAYDSHDPEIIDWHIDLAKGAGIDAFICTWWGRGAFDDRALATVLERAERKGFGVTVYWETVPGKGRAKIARAVEDLVYVLEEYGSHPAFMKIDGKPVVFVYGRVMGQIGTGEWSRIISLARERYGKDFLLIADDYSESSARIFDGIHTYNICGWVKGKSADELAVASRGSFRRAVRLAKDHARISCVTIIPGYDDTKIRTPGLDAERLGGETYRVLWEEAIAADPDWVLITSFNEWHEGSEIEPSREDGDKYIKMTGEHARRFKANPYSRAPVPEAPPGPPPEKAEALRDLYGKATIGVLPGFGGEAVYWLADTGVGIEELAWRDVLDPARFSVGRLPVVIYAGEESYVQTVREAGDVDDAIVRYLREGGLLIALSTGPFPFYYNEKGEAVVSAGKFGFPVGAGRERPPEGAKLTFKVDTGVLAGLPSSIAFPEAGDLRWRPCARASLLEGDVYLSLAKLVDERGGDHGDGIAYIEHTASEPKGAKNIYVWMRMGDLFESDELFFALFRLAAEKMAKAR